MYEKLTDEVVELLLECMRLNSTTLSENKKGENAIIAYLSFIDMEATPTELSKHLKIGSGGIANALKQLENKGLIIRVNDEKDKRVTKVLLSDEGKQAAKMLEDYTRVQINKLLTGIGQEDSEAMIRIMRYLIAHKEEYQC